MTLPHHDAETILGRRHSRQRYYGVHLCARVEFSITERRFDYLDLVAALACEGGQRSPTTSSVLDDRRLN